MTADLARAVEAEEFAFGIRGFDDAVGDQGQLPPCSKWEAALGPVCAGRDPKGKTGFDAVQLSRRASRACNRYFAPACASNHGHHYETAMQTADEKFVQFRNDRGWLPGVAVAQKSGYHRDDHGRLRR